MIFYFFSCVSWEMISLASKTYDGQRSFRIFMIFFQYFYIYVSHVSFSFSHSCSYFYSRASMYRLTLYVHSVFSKSLWNYTYRKRYPLFSSVPNPDFKKYKRKKYYFIFSVRSQLSGRTSFVSNHA